jgi:hypothetical protein
MRSPTRPASAAALVLTLLCSLCAPAHAQWQWKDKNGQVTASDRPPPKHVVDKDIISRPDTRRAPPVGPAVAPALAPPPAPAPAPALVPAKGPLETELETRKRNAEQEQTTKNQAEDQRVAEQRAENCRRARSHQSALDSGQRIARTNEKGEREVLDDKARADEIRRAREVIASDCK